MNTMTNPSLQFPEQVRKILLRRYRAGHRTWLNGGGKWPLILSLGNPREDQAERHSEILRAWIQAWQSWQGGGEILWRERQWRNVGVQRLPGQLVLSSAETVAAWAGEETRWRQGQSCIQRLVALWPSLILTLPRYFDVLADYTDEDCQCLERLLTWLIAHPHSGLYLRQLPVAGIDSKWLESRQALVADCYAAIQPDSALELDFFQRCGLKPVPRTIRMRLLDENLRRIFGGLSDITAPVADLAALALPITKVFIVENLQTGLAFTDVPHAIVIMGLGYGIDILAHLPWLKRSDCYYWGDIDTHGFAILNRVRPYLPNIKSVLMDENTLLSHRHLWVTEKKPHKAADLALLTPSEKALYNHLQRHTWGVKIRLEQERVHWNYAWQTIEANTA